MWGEGLSKWAEAENGKENKPRVQEFMAAWDAFLFKKKKKIHFLLCSVCCCTWDFSGGNEQVGGYSLVAEHKALGHTGSGVVVHRLSCSAAGGVFLDQGSNPSLLHCQVDSEAVDHQGSPMLSSQDKQTKQNKF